MKHIRQKQLQRNKWNKKNIKTSPFDAFKITKLYDGDKVLLYARPDTTVDFCSRYLDALCKCFPKCSFGIVPGRMFVEGNISITGKEYTMLNNILKRMMEKEND